MSFIRNPPSNDKAGNPPWDASKTPGVVNMKLIVATNNMIASRLPTADTLGHHGLTASSAAAASSNTPSSAEKADGEDVVQPAHEGTRGNQRLDALSLVLHELQAAVPRDHDDEAVPGEQSAYHVDGVLSGGCNLLSRHVEVVPRSAATVTPRRPFRFA